MVDLCFMIEIKIWIFVLMIVALVAAGVVIEILQNRLKKSKK